LLLGALPYWSSLRQNGGARAALRGANATVVGILLAALYNPVWTVAVDSSVALIIALAAFGLLHSGNGHLGCSFSYRELRVLFFCGSSRGGLIQMVSAKTYA
jgi:hypothetical protein